MSDEPFAGPIERIDSLTTPSITTVETTFTAIKRTVDGISADCRAVSETLKVLDDALHVITDGSKGGQEWGGLGLIGLPIAGALRAAKSIASQHVKQQTGVPLDTWTDLVATSSAQFSAYVSRLDTAAQLCARYRASTGSDSDPEQLRTDLQALLDVRWHTQAWKQILGRVAQLGQVVEAILQADFGEETEPAEPVATERSTGFSASLQRRLKEVQSRTAEKSGALGEWVLRPFVEVRDKVRQLPAQTEHLAHEVTLLEVLLDLQIAAMRAYLGDISPGEARIVGMRVAVGVVLPELMQELEGARERARSHESYLGRLNDARDAGGVDERAYAILAEEYRTGLDGARTRVAALEAQAEVWRRDGKAVLDASTDWAKLQLDILAARRLVEQDKAADDRGALLRRELQRLDEARSVLAAL